MSSTNQSKRLLLGAALLSLGVASMLAPEVVFAQNTQGIGKVAGQVSNEIVGAIPLVNTIAYLVGGVLCLVALFMFKKNRDDPRDTPLSKPMWTLIVAVGFLFMPTVVGIGAKTMFGTDGTAVEVKGSTFNIPK